MLCILLVQFSFIFFKASEGIPQEIKLHFILLDLSVYIHCHRTPSCQYIYTAPEPLPAGREWPESATTDIRDSGHAHRGELARSNHASRLRCLQTLPWYSSLWYLYSSWWPHHQTPWRYAQIRPEQTYQLHSGVYKINSCLSWNCLTSVITTMLTHQRQEAKGF